MARSEWNARISALLLSLCLLSQVALGGSSSGPGRWLNATTSLLEHHDTPSSSSAVSTKSSLTSSSAESPGLGAFVAAGMGMTRSLDGNTTSIASKTTIFSPTGDHKASFLSNGTTSSRQNYVSSFEGNCWEQWSAYWSASELSKSAWTYSHRPSLATDTRITYSAETSIEVFSGTTTETVLNGVHPQKTLTAIVPTSTFVSIITKGTVSTVTSTWTSDEWISINTFGTAFIEPTCSLPNHVPACQSKWESWIDHNYNTTTAELYTYYGPSPACAQAKVTGAPCSMAVSNYLKTLGHNGYQSGGVVLGGLNYTEYVTTTGTANVVTTVSENIYFWNTSSEIVPGCTLGCHSCQVNGGTVQLVYWPPETSTWTNGQYSAVKGNRTGPSTLVTLGTTLTSPTVYVSFDSLWARDSCSAFSKTYTNQIVAITNTADLSSLYGWGTYNGVATPASFNFTDLYVRPVPDYIYQSQPRCASSALMFDPLRGGNWSERAHWTCPRTEDYDPILSIPLEVRKIDPDWADCIGGINGAYDPPIALTPAALIAKPTVAGANPKSTSDAAPASSPKPTHPPVTAKPSTIPPSAKPQQNPEPSQVDQSSSPDHHGSPSSKGDGNPNDPNTNKDNPVQTFTQSVARPGGQNSPQDSSESVSSRMGDPARPPTAHQTQRSDAPADSVPADTLAAHGNGESSREQPSQTSQLQQSRSDNAPLPVRTGQSTNDHAPQGVEQDPAPSGSHGPSIEETGSLSSESSGATANALSVLMSAVKSAWKPAATQGAPAGPHDPGDQDAEASDGKGSVSTVNDKPGLSASQSLGHTAGKQEPQSNFGEPDNGSPEALAHQGAGPTADASSVVSGVRQSAIATEPSGNDAGTQMAHGGPAEATSGATHAAANHSFILAADGGSAASQVAGNTIIVLQDGLLAAAAPGSVATSGTHVHSVASDGGAIIVDSSATHSVTQVASPVAQTTAFTVNGQLISASKAGSDMVIADGSQTIATLPGSTVKFGSQDIELQSNGAQLTVDTSTFVVTGEANTKATEPVAIWTKDDSIFTAISQNLG